MSFDYTTLRDGTVEKLIENFGDQGYLQMLGESIGAPYESQLDNDSEVPVLFVRINFEKADNNGTLVEANDQLFLVSTQGLNCNEPLLANKFLIDDLELQVVRVDPLRPGPITMLWKVHVRK